MVNNHKPLLAEFAKETIDSHVLIVAQVMSGERPGADTLLELGVEALTVDRLATLMARQVESIKSAHACWQDAHACFETCADLWNRLPVDDLLAGHGRLLCRLIRNAQEREKFYCVTDRDRQIYNAQRDHGMPLTHAVA